MRKWLPIVLLCAWPLLAQKYTGPRPAKPDLPYLMHADNLIPAESAEAKQEDRKGEVTYLIPGANSTVRTPLASPAFLILTDQLQADRLQLFKLQSKGGQREVLFRRKNKLVAPSSPPPPSTKATRAGVPGSASMPHACTTASRGTGRPGHLGPARRRLRLALAAVAQAGQLSSLREQGRSAGHAAAGHPCPQRGRRGAVPAQVRPAGSPQLGPHQHPDVTLDRVTFGRSRPAREAQDFACSRRALPAVLVARGPRDIISARGVLPRCCEERS